MKGPERYKPAYLSEHPILQFNDKINEHAKQQPTNCIGVFCMHTTHKKRVFSSPKVIRLMKSLVIQSTQRGVLSIYATDFCTTLLREQTASVCAFCSSLQFDVCLSVCCLSILFAHKSAIRSVCSTCLLSVSLSVSFFANKPCNKYTTEHDTVNKSNIP